MFFSLNDLILWIILKGMELRIRVVITITTTDHHVFVSDLYFSMSTVYYQFRKIPALQERSNCYKFYIYYFNSAILQLFSRLPRWILWN